ncbi:MAG: hypothetical protein V4515_11720 [Chloroflexota bacterium]
MTTEGRTLTGISANAGTGTQAFTYDALRRVTKATIPGTNTTCGQAGVACYGYDRNGNRTTKQVNATTTTTYHPTDEIETQTISGVIKSFVYNIYTRCDGSSRRPCRHIRILAGFRRGLRDRGT